MPTAARLVAAISMAVLAYVVSGMVMSLMPESTDFGCFVPINIGLGIAVGWIAMGKRAGGGTTAAINNGLTGTFILMLWGVGVQAAIEMTRLAMRNRYDDALEAMVAVFQIGAEYVVEIATVPIGVALVIGAIVAGLLTDFAARRWK